MKIKYLLHPRGFTLIELMLSMVVFGVMMTSVLESVASITIARTKSMNRIVLLEELYFFSEKLATQIKEGGIIDYEEYWNRQVVGTVTASGHYITPTGFGNYGAGGSVSPYTNASTNYGNSYYYCRSTDPTSKVGTGGCLVTNNGSSSNGNQNTDYTGAPQRYGQYALQFTDYNGNADSDTPSFPGDEDNTNNMIGDEDDKEIGDGPIVLSGSSPELYLINHQTKERLYFRWYYEQDLNNPVTCNFTTAGSGCIGNIEVLRLRGLDIGMNHSGSISDTGAFDGEIDTWACHRDWRCSGPTLPPTVGGGELPTGADSEWVPLFPDYVNVKAISFSLYPRKDPWRSWAAPDCVGGSCASDFISPFIHPYVRMEVTLGLAWERRKLITGDDPTIAISTTISLSNTTVD